MEESRRHVYCLTNPIELRFKEEQPPQPPQLPLSPRSPKAVISNLFSLVVRRKDKFTFPDVPAVDKPVRLKFIDKLTSECIVVGNHRELDVLGISLIRDEFTIDTRLVGRITPPFDMQFMRIQRKKSMVVVAGQHNLTVYEVNLKVDSIKPWASSYFDQPIVGVEILNETTFYVYHEQFVEVVNSQYSQLKLREKLPYNKPLPGLQVLCIPKLTDKCSFIFFYQPEELESQSGLFSLHKCLLSYDNSEFKITPIVNVYKLDVNYFKNMQLLMYDRQTFLINLITQILVIKKHYPIDVGELKYRNENSRLVYMENRNLLHVCDSRAELHTLTVHSNSIVIKSFDCIKLTKPQDSNFMTAIDLDGDRFLLVYSKAANSNIRETKYWLMATIESTIKTKLKQLLMDTKDLRDIQDVAEKMGMMKKQIFLELWCQSSKRTKNDFDILLETNDYKTIMSQLKMALRKNSVSFRQIERIERTCFLVLEKKISEEPTEGNLRRYIKSHFMLRKYMVVKNIQGKRRVSMAPTINEEESKMMLSIQDFQDIRKRNVKNYIVELMKGIVKDPSRVSLHETLDMYVEGFKFVLRRIYPEFLKDIISELGEDLLILLQEYPQLLPIENNQGKYLGVWADITSAEWDKHIYFEKLQTVDNVAVLNEMMKKDWFRWDWLIKHDLLQLKRHEFEKEFVSSRQCTIYYRLLDLLFNIIKDHEKRVPIVEFIEGNYTIPEHLPGRIRLYWQLHCFFSLPDRLPGYKMRFEQFLPLREQDIFRMVFSSEKNSKRLVLTDIKDIYRMTTPPGYYDNGVLSYFRSGYSSIADLKYLLNRINNQKIQFHEENQNLYAVLVEAVFYKLAWHGSDPIPIKDVLVYFESIPLSEPELLKLQLIERLKGSADLFYQINLNMNLRDFFDKGEQVMRQLAQIYIEKVVPSNNTSRTLSAGSDSPSIYFADILDIMLKVRYQLLEHSLSDLKVMEIVISHAMNFDDLIPDVETLIFREKLLEKYDIYDPQDFLECIVAEKIDKAFEAIPQFGHHKTFINSLLNLLPKNTPRKKALTSHLELGLMLEKLEQPTKAPLIISSRFIEQVIFKQKTFNTQTLDIDLVYNHMLAMGTREPKSSLYETLILKFLEDGEWKDAIMYTRLWNESSSSNIFAALIALKVGEQLSKDLKENLLDIVIMFLWRPKELLNLIEQIILTDDSNVLKQLISQVLFENDLRPEDYYERNCLLSDLFKKLDSPGNIKLIKDFYTQLRRSDVELQRNETYYLYYRLLLCEPERAHELHEKYFDWIDIRRIEYLVREMSRNKRNIFNSLQVLLFAYKSMLALFSLNYLGKEFDSLSELFAMGYNEVRDKYQQVVEELEEEMKIIQEHEKLEVLHNFEKIYLRKREKEVVGDNMSMEVESEDENSRNDQFLRSKPFNHRGAAIKRTMIPPMKISENPTYTPNTESNNLVWKNLVEQQSNSLRMTASIRRKDSKREELPKNLRNTMRVFDRNKIVGAFGGNNDSGRQSPPSSTRKSKQIQEEVTKRSNGQVHEGMRSDRETFCEVVEQNVGLEDAGFEKKGSDELQVPPVRLLKKTSDKSPKKNNRQLYFGTREGLSRSELPSSIKELVKNEMAHLFAEELEVNSKKGQQSAEHTSTPHLPDTAQRELPVTQSEPNNFMTDTFKSLDIPLLTFKGQEIKENQVLQNDLHDEPKQESGKTLGVPTNSQTKNVVIDRVEQGESKPINVQAPAFEKQNVIYPKASIDEAVEILRSEKPLVGIIKGDGKMFERKNKDAPKRSIKKFTIKIDNEHDEDRLERQTKIEVLDVLEKSELTGEASANHSKTTSRKGSENLILTGPADEGPRSEMGLQNSQTVRQNQEKIELVIPAEPKQEQAQPQVVVKRPRSPTFGRKNLVGAPQFEDQYSTPKNESKNQSMNSSNSRFLGTEEAQPNYLEISAMSLAKQHPQPKTDDVMALEFEQNEPRVLEASSAILNTKDYSVLQKLISQQKDQLSFLKRIVNEVFRKGTFKAYLDCIDKLKSINIKFHSAIRPQTIRVLKNAHKAELIFDLKLLYTPDVLFLNDPQAADIDSQNKLIFETLKPRIRNILNETNIFVVAKLMSVSFNFNKAFEYKVQYYYLEKVMRAFLDKSSDKLYDGKMDLEKIEAMLTRLPISITALRFEKMINPIKQINHPALLQLLELFKTVVQHKKETSEGEKNPQDIQQLEQQMQAMMWSLQP